MILADDRPIGHVSPAYAGYKRRAQLVVSARIDTHERSSMTIDHEPITGYSELAITAGVWNMNHSDFIICGQCQEALDNMVTYEAGWDHAKAMRLKAIWERWHLNGLRAGCAHGLDCPEGYKYGSAWLVEPLPDDIVAELQEMFA